MVIRCCWKTMANSRESRALWHIVGLCTVALKSRTLRSTGTTYDSRVRWTSTAKCCKVSTNSWRKFIAFNSWLSITRFSGRLRTSGERDDWLRCIIRWWHLVSYVFSAATVSSPVWPIKMIRRRWRCTCSCTKRIVMGAASSGAWPMWMHRIWFHTRTRWLCIGSIICRRNLQSMCQWSSFLCDMILIHKYNFVWFACAETLKPHWTWSSGRISAWQRSPWVALARAYWNSY